MFKHRKIIDRMKIRKYDEGKRNDQEWKCAVSKIKDRTKGGTETGNRTKKKINNKKH